MLPKFTYVRTTSIDEAVTQLSSDGARVHAGGSDLLGCLRDEVFDCHKVVSISQIANLSGVASTADGGIRIGALTKIADIITHPLIHDPYRALAMAASEVASPQLRNQGTIGGNICQKPRCWYYRGEFDCIRKGGSTCYALAGENQYHAILGGWSCYIVHPSDTAPALVALGATAHITGPRGTRTVPMAEFHVHPRDDAQRETVLEPSEIVTHIVLPPPPAGLRSSYRKVRARGAWDFALAGIALAVEFDGDRVTGSRAVLSGAAPVPWRSEEIEQTITGQQLTTTVAAEAAEAALASAVALKRNGYKVPLFKGLIQEELLKIAQV